MANKYLAYIALLLYSYTHSVQAVSQDLDYIILKGSCFDYGTGPDIKSEVYSITNDKRIHLGASNENGYFRVKVPINSRAILFKSRGFHDIELSTQFFGKIRGEVEFLVTLPTSVLDSAKVRIEDRLYLETQRSYKDNYKVMIRKSEDCLIDFDKKSLEKYPRSRDLILGRGSQLIGVQIKSVGNELILDKSIITGKGMNFLILDMPEPLNKNNVFLNRRVTLEPQFSRVIYFEQSSYELSAASKPVLDSLANILSNDPQQTVKLTGYTDNLGEKKKNLTLSEYRTRVVAKYLVSKGVSEAQLRKDWHGDENIISVADPNKNRRVVIETSN